MAKDADTPPIFHVPMLWVKAPKQDVPIGRNLWIRRSLSKGAIPIRPLDVAGPEFERIWDHKPDKPLWAIAESSDASVSAIALAGLVWLVTGQWRYHSERARVPRTHAIPRWPVPREAGLTPKRLDQIRIGAKLARSNRRFRIALIRWCSSIERVDSMDVVLDCCSCLEALFQTQSEHRLRTALSVRQCVTRNKGQAFRTTYDLYGLRSQFVHGARIPSVPEAVTDEFIGVAAAVLTDCIAQDRCPKPEKVNAAIARQLGGLDE
jgi:hypothetical protein